MTPSLRLLMLAAALCGSATLFTGCPTKKCDTTTCAIGCCDATGVCRSGDTIAACGTAGGACMSCLSGCSALKVCMPTGTGGGGGGVTGGGTGGGATGGGTSGDGGTRTVTVVRHLTRTIENGTVVNDDALPSTLTFAVLVRDGGGYQELPGSRGATTYTVPNVPAGTWFARSGTLWVETSGDQLDFGFNDLGRTDVTQIDAGAARLNVTVSGIPAWAAADDVSFFSVGANLYGSATAAFTTPPVAGQVPTSLSLDYGLLAYGDQSPAIDASKGDSLYLSYLHNEALITTPVPGAADDGGTLDRPLSCLVAKSSVSMSNVTITPGTNTVSASFVAAPTRSLGITWPRTQWAALGAEVHPDAITTYESLYYAAEPAPETASGDLVSCFNDVRFENPISDINRSLTVGNPYPTSWGVLGYLSTSYRVSKAVADAGTWSSTGFGSVKVGPGQPLVPGVHPPRAATVQSIGFGSVSIVATASALVVSWMPPATGPVPTDYRVQLVAVVRDSLGIRRSTVAAGLTRGGSFTFPAGLITLGSIYQLRVEARVSAAPESRPLGSRYDSTFQVISNPFLAQ